MVLQLFLQDKLVDSVLLSLSKLQDVKEKDLYIQGAVNALFERWSYLINAQKLKLEFFIKGQLF